MKLNVCEYCGTEYNKDQTKCPLCGKEPGEGVPAAELDRQTSQERIPQWMWILTCVLLGLAVVIGFVYFLVSMEYIGPKDDVQPVISAPVVEAPVEVLPEEPVVEEPEDLSCTDLTLSQEELVLDELGSHVFLTALPSPLDCEDEVRFTSLDESVATVDEGGMITAVAPGETEILVICGDVTASCAVICDFEVEETEEETEEEEPTEETEQEEVPVEEEEEKEEPAAEIALSSVDFTLFRPGEETVLTVKNAPDGAAVSYVSSDPSVATVSDTGKVVAVGDGTATITVTVDGQTLTCVARCNLGTTTENNDDTEAVPANLQLSHTDAMLFRLGETFVLSLSGDGQKVSGATFASENTGICTVNGNGLVTATGSGTTNVNVTYGGKTYTCIIRCNF